MLRRVIGAAAAAACAMALTTLPSAAKEKVPLGSFLTARASSVSELAEQVQKDPKVARRYARHFGVDPAQMADYITSELKLVSLQRPLRVTVWFVAKDGAIMSKPRVLPAGSMVFSNSEGRPVFLWICGNPLRDDLPRAVAPSPPTDSLKPEPPAQQPVVEETPVPPVTAAPDFLPQSLAPSSLLQGVDALISPPLAALPPDVRKRQPPLWLLGLLAAGGSGSGISDDGSKQPPVVAVPEIPAAGLSVLGLPLGAGLLLLKSRWSRSRQSGSVI